MMAVLPFVAMGAVFALLLGISSAASRRGKTVPARVTPKPFSLWDYEITTIPTPPDAAALKRLEENFKALHASRGASVSDFQWQYGCPKSECRATARVAEGEDPSLIETQSVTRTPHYSLVITAWPIGVPRV